MALRDHLVREPGKPTYQDYRQHLEWSLHILISMDTAYYVLLFYQLLHILMTTNRDIKKMDASL